MIRNFVSSLLLLATVSLFAQDKKMSVTLPAVDAEGLSLYVQPLNADASQNSVQLVQNGAEFTGAVAVSEFDFYRLVGVKNNTQIFVTLYLPAAADEASFSMKIKDGVLLADNSVDNRVLSECNLLSARNSRKLWHESAFDAATMRPLFDSYRHFADSVAALGECSPAVNDFLKVWAYCSTYDAISSARMGAKRVGAEFNLDASTLLEEPSTVLDNDIATTFFSTLFIIENELPDDLPLDEKFAVLFAKYKNEKIRARVGVTLTDKFLSTYNYRENFDAGREQLAAVVQSYGVSENVLQEYDLRRATIKGTPFPADVVLYDKDGNVVDFASFRGKYVYIDLWASWCGPCCREVPHLQKLEQELQNDNVVFVSISIDRDNAAWQKKMEALSMHGNQLIDSDNKIGRALGVRGIPFFVIYDKEGKLYLHGAPRPSSGDTVRELLTNLE